MKTKRKDKLFSYGAGFVQSRDVGRVIAQIDQLTKQGSVWSMLLKWTKGQWSSFDLQWTATRIWVQTDPEIQVFATGPEGRVVILTLKGSSEEVIDSSPEGPLSRGHIRDLRWIGKHLYACGMARQVYRREGPGKWVRFDEGVVLPLGDLSVAGFNAIDGLSEKNMYAVGFLGEIWRWTGEKWQKLDSPTNVILHRVRVIDNDFVYICGHKGTLLKGKDSNYEIVSYNATADALWGMEWFKGKLYVASENSIYRLSESNTLERLDLGEITTCGHLHANDGVMWSFGTKHVAWTEDARKWNDVTL